MISQCPLVKDSGRIRLNVAAWNLSYEDPSNKPIASTVHLATEVIKSRELGKLLIAELI